MLTSSGGWSCPRPRCTSSDRKTISRHWTSASASDNLLRYEPRGLLTTCVSFFTLSFSDPIQPIPSWETSHHMSTSGRRATLQPIIYIPAYSFLIAPFISQPPKVPPHPHPPRPPLFCSLGLSHPKTAMVSEVCTPYAAQCCIHYPTAMHPSLGTSTSKGPLLRHQKPFMRAGWSTSPPRNPMGNSQSPTVEASSTFQSRSTAPAATLRHARETCPPFCEALSSRQPRRSKSLNFSITLFPAKCATS